MIAPILLHVCLHYCYWPLTHTNALNFPKQKILKRRRLRSVAANMIALVCVRKRSNRWKKAERERERGRKNWNRKPEAEKMVVKRRIGLLWKRMMKYSTTAEQKRRKRKKKDNIMRCTRSLGSRRDLVCSRRCQHVWCRGQVELDGQVWSRIRRIRKFGGK